MNATTRTFRKRTGLPPAQGLYDPRFEHESCGVGFVCNIKGRASRGIVDDARHINCSMDHRGGIGYEPNTGDGAGILTSLPHRLFTRVVATDIGRSFPRAGPLRRRQRVPAARPGRAARVQGTHRDHHRGAGPGVPRLARAAVRRRARRPRQRRRRVHAAHGAALHRGGPPLRGRGLRAPALRHPQAREPGAARRRASRRARPPLLQLALLEGDRLQGHADPASALRVLRRSRRPRLRDPPRDGALAVQHQHLSLLGPGPAEPLQEPQRRDQHAAGQLQLDERGARA